MEKHMRARRLWFAAMLMVGAPAHAQADKPEPTKTQQEAQHPGALVLASAETTHSAVPAARPQSALSGKEIKPRVTTCRCGDPSAQADPDSQDQ
jgi:hypothetical protein